MKAIIENENKPTVCGDYELIKGDFTPAEAFEIISFLISTKINFHNLQNFSKQIRFNINDEASLKRIQELEISKESIKELVKMAKANGKSLRLKSTISIELF